MCVCPAAPNSSCPSARLPICPPAHLPACPPALPQEIAHELTYKGAIDAGELDLKPSALETGSDFGGSSLADPSSSSSSNASLG